MSGLVLKLLTRINSVLTMILGGRGAGAQRDSTLCFRS